MAGENIRSRLGADLQLILEAGRHHENGRLALAFEKRVGCNGRADLDGADLIGRDRRAGCKPQKSADTFGCSVGVEVRRVRQQLECRKSAFGRHRDNIREGAAAVDPELPAAARALHSPNHSHYPIRRGYRCDQPRSTAEHEI